MSKSEDTASEETRETLADDIQEELSADETEDSEKTDEAIEAKEVEENSEFQEMKEKYLRLYADFDNYRKRVAKEKTEIAAYAVSDVMKEILVVLDNFDRALESEKEKENPFYQGVSMVAKQLMEVLSKQGLEKMQSVGEKFDPNLHYAVMTEQNEELDEDIITDELQAGYKYKDKVIRPSTVKVNKK